MSLRSSQNYRFSHQPVHTTMERLLKPTRAPPPPKPQLATATRASQTLQPSGDFNINPRYRPPKKFSCYPIKPTAKQGNLKRASYGDERADKAVDCCASACRMSEGSIVQTVRQFIRTHFTKNGEGGGGGAGAGPASASGCDDDGTDFRISRCGSIVDQTIQFVTKEYEPPPRPPLTRREQLRRQQQVARGARCPLGRACTHGRPLLNRGDVLEAQKRLRCQRLPPPPMWCHPTVVGRR